MKIVEPLLNNQRVSLGSNHIIIDFNIFGIETSLYLDIDYSLCIEFETTIGGIL